MADNLNKKQAVEIFMIDEDNKYFHAGYCKCLIDLVSQALVIKNYDIDVLKFIATFDWHYVCKTNVLLAFAPNSCNKFILIFKDANICAQIYAIIANNQVSQIDDPETLLEQRFLIPVLETIQSHKDRAASLQKLLNTFVEALELPEKQMYMDFLEANNFYFGIYPQTEHDIEIIGGSSVTSSMEGVKEELSNFTADDNYDWSRGSPTSALVMNVVEAVSASANGELLYDVGQEESMEGYNTPGSSSMSYFNGSSTSQMSNRVQRSSTSRSGGKASKKKSYTGSIDNILSGRKTQIKRYKSYLDKLTGPDLTWDEKRKREEYLKCLAVVRITLVKARLQRDLNTFVKRSFGTEMRERLNQSNFTFEMAQEILSSGNQRSHRQLWLAFNDTLKNNNAFWDRVVNSKDEWNKAFNPDIKLNTYLYEQETGLS